MNTDKYYKSKVVLWIVFYVAVIDIAVNMAFHFPENTHIMRPTFLQEYFEYGRSVEGKLDRMTRNIESESGGILGYGWLENERYNSLPNKTSGNQTLIAVYGMSHAKLLAESISRIDKNYILRQITAPGAPPNWAYSAYEKDKEKHNAKVVILGIMTDAVPYISSTAGTTSYFDMSHPYTYPRYYPEGTHLRKASPPFFTASGFKEYFIDSGKWNNYREWLATNDKYYDTILFERSFTDMSAIFRVLRRAYSDMIKKKLIGAVYTNEGFRADSEEVIVLRAMVREFARVARDKNSLPFVYIVNNEGRGDHLYSILKPVLETNNIPYLSSHMICPPNDPRVYTGVNSHFTPEKDEELAKEVIKIIRDNI